MSAVERIVLTVPAPGAWLTGNDDPTEQPTGCTNQKDAA